MERWLHSSVVEEQMKKSESKKNAISLLKSQHREVEGLFERFEEAFEDDDSETRTSVAALVCQKLTFHATIEEEIFYPAAQSEETEDLLGEAAVEHLSAKRLIADIQEEGLNEDRLKALMTVLKEQIEHHVEEEENTLFPQVAKLFEKEQLQELGEQMEERLSELQTQAGAGEDHASVPTTASRGKRTAAKPSRSQA